MLAERRAGELENLERANDTALIARRDARRRRRIDLVQGRPQRLSALAPRPLSVALAERLVCRGSGEETEKECSDIEHGAAADDDRDAARARLGNCRIRERSKTRRGHVAIGLDNVDEVMGHGRPDLRRRLGCPDVHAPIDLLGVRRQNFAPDSLGDAKRELALARSRRSDDDDQGVIGGAASTRHRHPAWRPSPSSARRLGKPGPSWARGLLRRSLSKSLRKHKSGPLAR